MSTASRPIGVMDSGVGGISVLRALAAALPHEHFLYYGDTANAPYGTRPQEDILRLTRDVAHHLMAQGVKALVLACNTATGAALDALRQELPLPVLGIQPALAAAMQHRKEGEVLVMATPATLKAPAYRALRAAWPQGVRDLPCPGLMEFVERGETSGEALDAFLQALFAPLRDARIDAIALGCTHYAFLKAPIGRHFPEVPLVDDGERVAQRLTDELRKRDLLNPQQQPGTVTFQTSGDRSAISHMEHLFNSYT